jgi:hypothetical protein
MMPIFLWSTVKSHSRQPFDETGRATAPMLDTVVTTAGAAVSDVGRSMIAIVFSDHFNVSR